MVKNGESTIFISVEDEKNKKNIEYFDTTDYSINMTSNEIKECEKKNWIHRYQFGGYYVFLKDLKKIKSFLKTYEKNKKNDSKRINEILKSLNFPKFYRKTKENEFIFNSTEKYTDQDLVTIIDNLPFSENDIHSDDVDFIIQYLEYCKCINKNMIDSYLIKVLDNREISCNRFPKTDKIIYSFEKKVNRVINKIYYADLLDKE